MAINFPASPSTNDTHTDGNNRWVWNGSSWTKIQASAVTDTINAQNDNSSTTLYPVMVSALGSNQSVKGASSATKLFTFDASDGNLTVGGNISCGGTITYEDVKNVDSIGIVTARTGLKVGTAVTISSVGNITLDKPGAGIVTATKYYGDGSELTGITQVGGATTVGFNDNKPIYFGTDNDYKIYWNNNRMYFQPESSSITAQFEMVSNDQMYIHSKDNGMFLRAKDQNVIDIYGGSGGGIYFSHNATQKLKLEGGNWTYLNNANVTHAGDVQFSGQNYNAFWDKSVNALQFADNAKATWGNHAGGGDLQIYHDGTHSYLTNSTGAMLHRADDIRLQNGAGSEVMLDATANGAVKLYYDNSKKFETSGTGATLTGHLIIDSSSGSAIHIPDGQNLQIGTGHDIKISHNGSNSFFENLTGYLEFQGASNEKWIRMNQNGSVDLYYDNAKKAETVSGGFTVTGTCTATSFSGSGANLTGISASNLSASGEVDITSSGGAVDINAAHAVTIDSGYGVEITSGYWTKITPSYYFQVDSSQKIELNAGYGFLATGGASTGYPFKTKFQQYELYHNNGTDFMGFVSYVSSSSVAFGYKALQALSNKQAGSNTALGFEAGKAVTGGEGTYIGAHCGTSVTSGSANTFVGSFCGQGQCGNHNVAVGSDAFRNGTGTLNTAVGREALKSCTGNGNVAIGYQSGDAITSGEQNSLVGRAAGGAINTGRDNSCLGENAGLNLTTGQNNIVIGHDANASANNVSNEITLGDTNINKFRIPGIGITFATDRNIITGITTVTASGALFTKQLNVVGVTTFTGTVNVGNGDFRLGDANSVVWGADTDTLAYHSGLGFVWQNNLGDAVFSNNAAGQNIIFKTRPSSGSTAERLRITSSGIIGVNNANPNLGGGGDGIHIASSGAAELHLTGSQGSASTDGLQIQMSGTSANIINRESGIIRFYTGGAASGNERLRIGSAGQLGIAGANYGSSGQVLTSQGGSAAPTWAAAGGAGAGELYVNAKTGSGSLSDSGENVYAGYRSGSALTNGAAENCFYGWEAGRYVATGDRNAFFGAQAGENTTGEDNTAVGSESLRSNQTGSFNTAIGKSALRTCTSSSNTALGYKAGDAWSNGSAVNNVFIGALCADAITGGSHNVIIGEGAMGGSTASNVHSNVVIGRNAGRLITGAGNVILGREAAYDLTGSQNIIMGYEAAYNMTAGGHNICMGYRVAHTNALTSSHNVMIGNECCKDIHASSGSIVAIGANALDAYDGYSSTHGGWTVAIGAGAMGANRNTRHSVCVGNTAGDQWNPTAGNVHEGGCVFIGGNAGQGGPTTATSAVVIGRNAYSSGTNKTGNNNIAIGTRSLEQAVAGAQNVCMGTFAGYRITSGDNNVMIGYLTGYGYDTTNATQTGSQNTYIGGYAHSSANNTTYEQVLGYGGTGKGSNTTFIRGSSGCYQQDNSSSWSTTSDIRIKKNVVDNNIGLDVIENVRVRNFEYRTKEEITDFDNPESVMCDKTGTQLGVIAQEIQEVLPDVVELQTTGAYTVNPDNMTWYLVNAVKELSAEVKALKAQLNS